MKYDTKQVINEIIEKQEEDEFLLEMATIGYVYDKHHKCRFIITVDAECTHIGNAYFKIYDNPSVSKAGRVTRISFEDNKIIYHPQGRPPMPITKRIGKYINEFMKSPNPTNPSRSNWEECIIQYNLTNGRVSTPVNFTTLTKEEIKKYPRKFRYCLPIDLEMPDYTLLQ